MKIKRHLIAAAVATAISGHAFADDMAASDPAARIADLERQMQALSKELIAVQQQLAQNKDAAVAEKGKSEGKPMFAAFKDGLVFEDGTGNWKLQMNGRVQADYRTYDFRNNDTSSRRADTFSIRRARLGGTFTFLKDYSVRVEGEYANDNAGVKGTTAMTYGYLDINWWKQAKIRIGQFKPFFGLERAHSTNFIDFTELSLATNNGTIFNSTYDRGIMVFGDPVAGLNYNVYAINGTGQNNDDVNDAKDIGGRINANIAQFADIKNAVLHFGASASKGSIAYSSVASAYMSQSTEASGTTFFRVDGLQTTKADRNRWGLETALVYGPVKLQAEYIDANFEGKKGSTNYDNDINAWYADLSWMVTGESYADSYKSGIFGRIVPKQNFTQGKEGWGALEVGLRYSKFDASDFYSLIKADVISKKYTTEADAWTAGIKWIINPNARIMLNYVRTEFDTPIKSVQTTDDKEDAVVMRAQFDF